MTKPLPRRTCGRCGQSKLLKEFPSGSVRARCRACAREASHRNIVEAVYGLAPGEYDALLAKQGGACAICRGKPRRLRLAVDHDHTTGRVRGLLCKRCNHDLLGAAHDDPAILRRALEYLESAA